MMCCSTNGEAQAPIVKPSGFYAVVKMIGGDNAAGARHVFDDARRIARQVAADITRDHARVEIEGTAGRITDDNVQRFIFVESCD